MKEGEDFTECLGARRRSCMCYLCNRSSALGYLKQLHGYLIDVQHFTVCRYFVYTILSDPLSSPDVELSSADKRKLSLREIKRLTWGYE